MGIVNKIVGMGKGAFEIDLQCSLATKEIDLQNIFVIVIFDHKSTKEHLRLK